MSAIHGAQRHSEEGVQQDTLTLEADEVIMALHHDEWPG